MSRSRLIDSACLCFRGISSPGLVHSCDILRASRLTIKFYHSSLPFTALLTTDDYTYLEPVSLCLRAHLSYSRGTSLLPRRSSALSVLTPLALSTPKLPMRSPNVHARTLKFHWVDAGKTYEEAVEEYARGDEANSKSRARAQRGSCC
jgi:hypothetical protein